MHYDLAAKVTSLMRTSNYFSQLMVQGMRGSRGRRGQVVRIPSEKSPKKIGFPGNTGPDPLKITKLPSQYSMFGHHRHTSKTPFKWHFAGGPMMARLLWYSDPPSPHKLFFSIKVGPPLTKLSKICAC